MIVAAGLAAVGGILAAIGIRSEVLTRRATDWQGSSGEGAASARDEDVRRDSTIPPLRDLR
jgi:hypothetical protein